MPHLAQTYVHRVLEIRPLIPFFLSGFILGYVLNFSPGIELLEDSMSSIFSIVLNSLLNLLFNNSFLTHMTLRSRLTFEESVMAESIVLIRLHNPSVARR